MVYKVRLGICDKAVLDVLHTRLQSRDVASVDLDMTVVICSTVAQFNAQCLERLQGNAVSYEAHGPFFARVRYINQRDI